MLNILFACLFAILACLPASCPLVCSAFTEEVRCSFLFCYGFRHRPLQFRQARSFLIKFGGIGILTVLWLAWGAFGDASPAGEFMRSVALVSIVYIVMGTAGTIREIKARLDGIEVGMSVRLLIDDKDKT